MITKMYVIFDTKAGIFNKPFFQVNESTARRSCQTAMADPNTEYSQHPTDFSLFYVGQYDDETGKIAAEPPMHVATFSELKAGIENGEA